MLNYPRKEALEMQIKTTMTEEQRKELIVALLYFVKHSCKEGSKGELNVLPGVVEALLRFAR